MSKMVSPAGDLEVIITDVVIDKNRLRIDGRFGVWDSQLFLTVDDIAYVVRRMMKPSALSFILRFPFLYLALKVARKGTDEQ